MENKFKKKLIKLIGKVNNLKIKNKKITIISNNCWGGIFYRNHNLEYLSPTIGLFFMGDDYIKFIYNIQEYINLELEFIKIEDSKYYDYLRKIGYNSPIGKINDVEIMFMHYKDEQEALEKWNRRKKRIDWNNIIYKFSDQNCCSFKNLEDFQKFNAKNKILFTTRKYEKIDSIQIKKYKNSENVGDDIKSYKKYFNMVKYINNIKSGKNES